MCSSDLAPPPGEKLKADDFIELDVLGVEEEVRGFIFAFSKYMKQAAKENKVNLSEMFGDVQKDPFKNLSKAGKEIRDAFLPIQNWKGFEGLTQFQVDLANTGEMIANMLTPSLDAMIQAIGRGENAFKAFGEGVKGILLQVMQKLAATAILAGVLAALFPTGIGGSQGFGAIFGKLLGFKANGGPVGGGNPYIVGERGPELFVPSVSGSIVPNHQVGSFMGGRGSSGGGGSVLRGQDIILAYARTQRSQLRVKDRKSTRLNSSH